MKNSIRTVASVSFFACGIALAGTKPLFVMKGGAQDKNLRYEISLQENDTYVYSKIEGRQKTTAPQSDVSPEGLYRYLWRKAYRLSAQHHALSAKDCPSGFIEIALQDPSPRKLMLCRDKTSDLSLARSFEERLTLAFKQSE